MRSLLLAGIVLLALPAAAQNPLSRGSAPFPVPHTAAGGNGIGRLAFAEAPVSGVSPFPIGCGITGGTLYRNAEVEPWLAVNPGNDRHWIAVWQQDRWSNGSSRGLVTAVTFDAGATWSRVAPRYTVCSGGTYQRASDPWVDFSPDGTAWQIALVTSGASFTTAAVNAIVVSRSTDGGLTWAAPVRVNPVPGKSAFAPQVHVASDGTVGVTYYDLRADTPSIDNLLADYWIARSQDGGLTWTESHIAGPFDMLQAPVAGGYFLGDYMGLASAAGNFLALHTRTTGDANNPTDIFVSRIPTAPSGVAYVATQAKHAAPDAALRRETRDTIRHSLEARGVQP